MNYLRNIYFQSTAPTHQWMAAAQAAQAAQQQQQQWRWAPQVT